MNVGFINQNVSPRLNMGLAYIMTMASQKHHVFFWDIVGKYKYFAHYVEEQIRVCRPSAIGFSVNSYTFRSALQWAQLIKEKFPTIRLIFGGVHPTIRPLECIHHPLVDIICIGEGEYSISECLDCLERHELPFNIDGIWFKDEKRNIIKNKLRSFVEDLDALPFPNWDLWDIDLYIKVGGLVRNSLKILASRGCYHNCNFCTAPVIRDRIPGQYYRVRSPSNVISEIKYLKLKYYSSGLRYISFADPLFGADHVQFDTLTTLYKQEGLADELPWICETRPDVITEEWAERARTAGCMVVSLGIESGDSSFRKDILGKSVETKDIKNTIAHLEKNNILYILYLILCAPGETFRTINETLDFGSTFHSIKTYFLYFLPLPETPLYEECKHYLIDHSDTKFDDGFWNKPNIRLKKINVIKYFLIRFRIMSLKFTLFFRNGWRLRKIIFFIDIIKYGLGQNRVLPFSNPYAQNELYQNTVLKYFLEDTRSKRIVNSLGT